MNCSKILELAPLYLSGELDTDRAAELRAHFDSCGQCRREIESQIELDERLRQELLADATDSSAVEARVRQVCSHQSRFVFAAGRAAVAIAASVLLAIAAAAAIRFWPRPQPVAICADAARDHRREIVRQEPRRWASDVAGIDTLAGRAGASPSILARLALPGYQVERGRLCRLNGQVYLHLVYSNGAREFSLYLGSAAGPDRARDLYTADASGEHTATLQSHGQRVVVVTDGSPETARNLAQIAARAL